MKSLHPVQQYSNTPVWCYCTSSELLLFLLLVALQPSKPPPSPFQAVHFQFADSQSANSPPGLLRAPSQPSHHPNCTLPIYYTTLYYTALRCHEQIFPAKPDLKTALHLFVLHCTVLLHCTAAPFTALLFSQGLVLAARVFDMGALAYIGQKIQLFRLRKVQRLCSLLREGF